MLKQNPCIRNCTAVFHSIPLSMYVKAKSMHETESHENTTVSAAILCPSVCISEVTNKDGYCKAKRVKYFMNQMFLPHTVKSEPAWLTLRNSTLSQKDFFLL